MRIVVTGCQGTLGKPLVKALREKGHEVFGIDVSHTADVRVSRADVANFRELQRALKTFEPDMVYHLAAEFGRFNGEDYYERLWASNAVGTKNVLTLQKEMKFKMIFASSSEVYGESRLDYLSEEILDRIAVRYYNDYAMSKRVNEWQIQNAIEKDGVEVMTLRFFNAYGPGETYHKYRSVVCLFVYSALKQMPVTVYKDYKRVFMFIDDFIPTLALACEKFKSGGVFNVGGTEFRSVEDLMNLVVKCVPSYPPELIKWMTKEDMNVANKRPLIDEARRQFGHNPVVTLEEGIPKTVEWMRQTYGGM